MLLMVDNHGEKEADAIDGRCQGGIQGRTNPVQTVLGLINSKTDAHLNAFG